MTFGGKINTKIEVKPPSHVLGYCVCETGKKTMGGPQVLFDFQTLTLKDLHFTCFVKSLMVCRIQFSNKLANVINL